MSLKKACQSSVICFFNTIPGKGKTKQKQKQKTRINPVSAKKKKERNLEPILLGGDKCLILPTRLT